MKIYRNIKEFQAVKKAVVTIGAFDGVHIGHKKILNRLTELSNLVNGESVLITFWPHPRFVLKKDAEPIGLLNTLEEKIHLLDTYNIDHLLILNFNEEFSKLTADSFIDNILIKAIGTKYLVLGYDHRFGNNREGGIDYLNAHKDRFGIEAIEIPKQEIESLTISSTLIRKALLNGDSKTANQNLGYPYLLRGFVIEGNRLGRTIGFPTANIFIEDQDKLIPKNGVYAVHVYLEGERYKGMLNIGVRPTINNDKRKTIEVHIFDFDKEIYGKTLRLELHTFMREEEKFNGLEALVEQLKKDEITSRLLLK
ncbi:bifunctional riboflavin kinase/FAD synthetase [uncultured Cytophaga sp.]|uniref:bifunctional riboflavin kinase/FAD synthetase n=1 Tax=uncultured Cytophaga sp. TaxID=160238 RepID=UPI00262EDCC0|nr:bifunctional riboflavin kinase/FAD synthetase [uncultured Cytophaga sp.]